MTLSITRPTIVQDVADLRRYLVRLPELLADQASGGPGSGGKVSGSPAPWNDAVGDLLTDVHAGARQLADHLGAMMGDRPRPRGSTTAGTMVALSAVAAYVARLRSFVGVYPRAEAEHAERVVAGWAVRCRQELGELREGEESWTRAPGGLRCPNSYGEHRRGECGAELWLAPGWALSAEPSVYCRSTSCLDTDGRPCEWTYDQWRPLVGDDRL